MARGPRPNYAREWCPMVEHGEDCAAIEHNIAGAVRAAIADLGAALELCATAIEEWEADNVSARRMEEALAAARSALAKSGTNE